MRTFNQKLRALANLHRECEALEAIQDAFEKTPAGIAKIAERKEKANEQVRINAERVYQNYLSRGVAIATERKALYLQRNLIH